ncbi:YhcB family protein [Aquisalimonas asiatica]|uniref:Z-ring associated protein G n=1 Tax=Aquisalimonas asiatica TaxID=406100 RepID=A0A1H8Q8Q1_9GAMM|nr:DUF1043 family protein [Aquisalimonas asiatica]SEO50590.1 hypothetical protein SAMN04488052_101425 [Aquisalimonas asiatica]
MTTAIWIIVVLICLVGGIWLGRYTAPGVEKAREMEQERDEANAELQRYREDVRTHFEKTAHLFNTVTGSYRQLYEHLAEGSERLGTGTNSGLLETRPEDRQLQGPEDIEGESEKAQTAASNEASGADAAAEPAEEHARAEPEQKAEQHAAPEPEEDQADKARRPDADPAAEPAAEHGDTPTPEDVQPPRDHADTDEEAGRPEDEQRRA